MRTATPCPSLTVPPPSSTNTLEESPAGGKTIATPLVSPPQDSETQRIVEKESAGEPSYLVGLGVALTEPTAECDPSHVDNRIVLKTADGRKHFFRRLPKGYPPSGQARTKQSQRSTRRSLLDSEPTAEEPEESGERPAPQGCDVLLMVPLAPNADSRYVQAEVDVLQGSSSRPTRARLYSTGEAARARTKQSRRSRRRLLLDSEPTAAEPEESCEWPAPRCCDVLLMVPLAMDDNRDTGMAEN